MATRKGNIIQLVILQALWVRLAWDELSGMLSSEIGYDFLLVLYFSVNLTLESGHVTYVAGSLAVEA